MENHDEMKTNQKFAIVFWKLFFSAVAGIIITIGLLLTFGVEVVG